MLSETTDGDYLVRRFVVKRQGDTDYSIRYQINLARLSSGYDGNSRELDALNNFIGNMVDDSLMRVESVVITGYSSPDGPLKFNETLAANRARDFKNYVDKKYDFSKKFDVTVNSVAEDWEMCRALTAQSDVPDKQRVLAILDGSQSNDAKEAALKKMPAVWDYMRKNILPPLRRVELAINYGEGSVVEQRTMIPRPKPAPEPAPACPCTCVVVDDAITGIIVAMPDAEATDYHELRRTFDREMYRDGQISRREARIAEKIARKEAKAARKAEKQARKTYRELEKM